MERIVRQSAVVGVGGRVELTAPDLAPGTLVEAILILEDAEERDGLVRAILEGEADVAAGHVRPAEGFFAEHTGRYGVPG